LPAETVGQWLSVVSGLLVLGMGFWLFQRGLLAYHGIRPMPGHSHGPGGHSHGHHHEHSEATSDMESSAAHEHSHAGHGHSHAQPHVHEHSHSATAGTMGSSVAGRQPPRDSPLEEYGAPATASEDTERRERGRDRWGLIGLGMAGGIVPCFDALAILIAAVNLRRIGLGLAMIGAFSVGMAAVLVGIGVLMVTAKSLMRRFTGESAWVRALPAVSGAVLFFLGAWLTLESLAEAGVIHLG
jgi:ABC-type nickel/cobalt efflux system permease component RcnA